MPATTIETVKDLDDLRARVKAGHHTFAILLAGGLAYSRKTIWTAARGTKWRIKNHIDDTHQLLTDDELRTESNIAVALENGAFVQMDGGRTIRGSVEA